MLKNFAHRGVEARSLEQKGELESLIMEGDLQEDKIKNEDVQIIGEAKVLAMAWHHKCD